MWEIIDVEVTYEFNGVADDREEWYLLQNTLNNRIKRVDEYNYRLMEREGLIK